MNMNNNLINKRAFTLIEFMIAMSIALLITTIVSKAILSGTRSANVLTSKVYGQKSVRSAISFIAKDLMAAESITEPAIEATGPGLTIQGSKFKQAAMTSSWPTNADSTQFKAAGASQGVAWTKGKPPVIYVDGDPVDPTTTEYTLNYDEGLIDFTSEDPPEGAVTADFSTDITITYSLDTIDNNTRLMRGTLVIADDVENTDIFEREADKMFNIKVLSREFELRTTIDASTGAYVVNQSKTLRTDLGLLETATLPSLNSLFFNGLSDGWAVGNSGSIYRYNGAWSAPASPTSANLNNISFADTSTGFMTGNNGTAYSYNGAGWTDISSISENMNSAYISDNNDIGVVGAGGAGGTNFAYDGSAWSNGPLANNEFELKAISQYASGKYAAANNGMVYNMNFEESTPSTSTVTITAPGKDTHVRQETPNTNWNADFLRVGYTDMSFPTADYLKQTLIEFDLSSIPAGSYITDAQLVLRRWWGIDNGPFLLHSIDEGWSESTVTWNNKPAYGSYTGGTVTGGATGYWQVTDLVDGWYRGSRTNNGMIIVPTQFTLGADYYASDYNLGNPANNPQLIVEYADGPSSSVGIQISNEDLNSINLIKMDNDPSAFRVWAVGNNGFISFYDSTSPWEADSWNNIQVTTNNLNSIKFFDENIGWAVGDAGTILRYDVELDQWFEIPSGTNENLNDVFIYSRDEGYVVGDKGTVLKIGSVRL